MNEKEVKVILLGNSGVGKTSLINVCLDVNYRVDSNSNNIPPISGYYIQKLIECEGKKYILDLWDTAGQEAYLGITKLFFKGSEIIIFVYDISAINSYNDLNKWIDMTEEIIDNKHVCAIVGNKNDLYLNAEITEEEAKKFAESKNCLFKLVSAKTDPKGFNEFLEELVKEYKDKLDNPKNKRRKSIKLEPIPDIQQNEQNKKKCCS